MGGGLVGVDGAPVPPPSIVGGPPDGDPGAPSIGPPSPSSQPPPTGIGSRSSAPDDGDASATLWPFGVGSIQFPAIGRVSSPPSAVVDSVGFKTGIAGGGAFSSESLDCSVAPAESPLVCGTGSIGRTGETGEPIVTGSELLSELAT